MRLGKALPVVRLGLRAGQVQVSRGEAIPLCGRVLQLSRILLRKESYGNARGNTGAAGPFLPEVLESVSFLRSRIPA